MGLKTICLSLSMNSQFISFPCVFCFCFSCWVADIISMSCLFIGEINCVKYYSFLPVCHLCLSLLQVCSKSADFYVVEFIRIVTTFGIWLWLERTFPPGVKEEFSYGFFSFITTFYILYIFKYLICLEDILAQAVRHRSKYIIPEGSPFVSKLFIKQSMSSLLIGVFT